MALFFFMMVFMDTTATIPTGAMAERWAWKNFCLYGLWVALPYCLYANWVWGGGWLAQGGLNWGLGHGAVDFAGSGVVHAMGGIIGLAGAIVIGPRIGKYVDGKPQAMPGHNVPMVVLGTFILAFGWFGFNPGSTLAGHRPAHQLRRREHDAREHHRRDRGDARRCMVEGPEARPDDALQRHARRAGRDHRAVRLRRSVGGGADRRDRRRARRLRRVLLRERAASTIRSARSPCTA